MKTKADTTMKLVGAQPQEVTNRLLSIWDARADTYDIDHVFPFRFYDMDCEGDQHKVMHISNLQPLTKQENRTKWDRLPTKAMAARVDRSCWPDGVTEDMLPEKYPDWSSPLRM